MSGWPHGARRVVSLGGLILWSSSQDIPLVPPATNTATRKGWTTNSNELKSVLGITGVNFNSGRFRLQFVNTSARNSFMEVVSEIESTVHMILLDSLTKVQELRD